LKVLLINPTYAIERYMGQHLARVGWVMPPMGLLYIAAKLEAEGHAVDVYDSQVDRRSIEGVISSFSPDVVGITSVSALFESASEAAKLVKDLSSDITVVMGGVHPTVRSHEVLARPQVDFAVRGEGILTMGELLNAIEAGGGFEEIPGLSFRDEMGNIHDNPGRKPEKNVDQFPFPARHLVRMQDYRMSPDWSIRKPFDIVFTAFGCPYKCIFCAAQLVSGGHYRMRSIPNVMEEIDLVVERYKLRSLLIGDDNFVVSKKRALDFCEQYSSRGYHKRIPWQVSTRVDTVDREILRAMKAAGCYLLSFGIESGVPRLLDLVGKKISLEDSERAVRLAHEEGLKVRGTFILGLPTETREESLETIRFSRKLPFDQVRFALATPFPGTGLWEIAKKENGLHVDDYMSLSLMGGYRKGELPYIPQGRNTKELKKLQRRANIGFFFRLRPALGYFRRIRSFREFGEYIQGAWSLFRASFFRS